MANASTERGGYNQCDEIIAALEAAFVWVVFDVHLVAGRDRLRQVRHCVVAAVADAVDARPAVAEHEHPAFFLVGRALHPLVMLRMKARFADVIRQADLGEVGPAQLRP